MSKNYPTTDDVLNIRNNFAIARSIAVPKLKAKAIKKELLKTTRRAQQAFNQGALNAQNYDKLRAGIPCLPTREQIDTCSNGSWIDRKKEIFRFHFTINTIEARIKAGERVRAFINFMPARP